VGKLQLARAMWVMQHMTVVEGWLETHKGKQLIFTVIRWCTCYE
jgi:hypothetical protein